MLARLIAHDSFFAVKRVFGKLFQQRLGDELLRLDVDCEFDVMRFSDVHVLGAMKIFAKQLTRRARSFFGRVEIMLHEKLSGGEVELRQNSVSSQALNLSTLPPIKNREENKFSSRVKFGVVTPKDFSKSLIKRRASMPLSFSLSHRLLSPPFNPLSRKFVKSWE